MSRLYLSPPHMDGDEIELVQQAFASNWITPLGPHVDAFETEFRERIGTGGALALSSGTAALHMTLRHLGVGRGDTVLCSTLTFVATVNPVLYENATPVFVDCDEHSWNMSPALLAEELDSMARRGQRPAAVIVADVFGQCADYAPIVEACERHGVPLIEDAAEALGATYAGRPAGSFGRAGIFSFNGNKIITTSGGGMLVSDDEALLVHARKMSTQAREPAPHYEHAEAGYNYRLSNLLAALGRGQLRHLDDRVAQRRAVFERYRVGLDGLPGIAFMPEPEYGRATRWLTCLTIAGELFGRDREAMRLALERQDIEARPLWKPMHMQPLFRGCRAVGGAVAERLFRDGLCLPSGSAMTPADQDRVISAFQARQTG